MVKTNFYLDRMRKLFFVLAVILAIPATAQQKFTVVKQNKITSVKNQYRSGTCWDFATLGFFESEILRKTGREYDLCEMFVVNKDYMDCATHYVRMHGYSQISEGANFKVFFPELKRTVSSIVKEGAKEPVASWKDSVQTVIEKYVGRCPESFVYEGKTYTPQSFAESLGLVYDDYVSLTSFTHHPFNNWFVIEAPYKWRLKPSYNIPIAQLVDLIDIALDAGYTVAWGGDVSGDFSRQGFASLPDGVVPTQQMRQEQFDDWRFTYDHVMLIYGKAVDEHGKPYYMVKNSWGESGHYKGTWYMSRDYMALNTTYIFRNRHALPKKLDKAMRKHAFM